MDGILNINKPLGMTSHDVVARVRKLLKQRRVGHAGTLDPAASGVLPICVGLGTRVAEYLSESGKAYQAEIIFGVVTDTYDTEGTVLRTHDATSLTQKQLEQALSAFLGEQMQQPPRYSAIKIQGQPAYKLARAGSEIELAPRPITISQLEILSWEPPRLTLAVACSKGTYIRSLAYDLGEHVGTGAHLGGLIRTRSGPFALAESITLDQLESAITDGSVTQYLFPADAALRQYPALTLSTEQATQVLHGNPIKPSVQAPQPASTLARIYSEEGQFLAIAQWDDQRQYWHPKKVFVTSTN